MSLNLLITQEDQAQSLSKLHLLTSLDQLGRQLELFLLAGKVSGLSDSTMVFYRHRLGAFVHFCRENQVHAIDAVTANHVRYFLLGLQKTNNPISVHSYFRAVKRFFNWLRQEEVLKASPVQNIRLGRLPQPIIRPFSLKDIDNLLLLCSGDSFLALRNRAIVLIFLDTGLRVSELAGLSLADIDLNRETLKVKGKGCKERLVRIGKVAQKALLKYLLCRKDNLDNVWLTEERRPLTKSGIQETIKALCRRAGITDAKRGPHTFRHTAAIHFLRNGGGEFILQNMLGHSTLKMTRRYVSTLGVEDMIKAHAKFSPVDHLFKTK
jgi:site-specific recombinase XerD